MVPTKKQNAVTSVDELPQCRLQAESRRERCVQSPAPKRRPVMTMFLSGRVPADTNNDRQFPSQLCGHNRTTSNDSLILAACPCAADAACGGAAQPLVRGRLRTKLQPAALLPKALPGPRRIDRANRERVPAGEASAVEGTAARTESIASMKFRLLYAKNGAYSGIRPEVLTTHCRS